jgi:glycosyltransferase involved in cell wall biosynthesis
MTLRVAAPWRTPVVSAFNSDHPIVLGLLSDRPGYRFDIDLAPPSPAARARAQAAADGFREHLEGLTPRFPDHAISAFVKSRDTESQAYVEEHDPGLVFMHGTPFTFGNRPWILHIEELLPLFGPYFWNGKSANNPAYGTLAWRFVKEILEGSNCRAIFTHLKHSADFIGRQFDSDLIASKTRHIPFGHRFPDDIEARVRAAQAGRSRRDRCVFLFTSSWIPGGEAFVIRGGIETLLAFGRLEREFGNVELVIRAALPVDTLGPKFADFVRGCRGVRVVDQKLGYPEFVDLLLEADVYMLPSCGLHTVSLIEGMATGTAVLASDAPGADEFVHDGRTGVIVPGRRGKLSWYDDRGYLHQTFDPLFKGVDQEFTDNLYSAMRRMVVEKDYRLTLGTNAFGHVRENHGFAAWFDGFGRVLEDVRAAL